MCEIQMYTRGQSTQPIPSTWKFDYGRPTGTEHEKVGQNPILSHLREHQKPEQGWTCVLCVSN